MRVADSSLLILGYQSHPKPIILPAATFNQYLKEEGLDAIAELRTRRNQTNSEAREIFERCAKSLVRYGTPANAQADRALGFTLELVAEKNPYTLHAGEDLPVSLMYEGRALPGALVVAMNRSNPMSKISARTDRTGHVKLRLPEDGVWLVKAVHMIPAPDGSNADWASFCNARIEAYSVPCEPATSASVGPGLAPLITMTGMLAGASTPAGT